VFLKEWLSSQPTKLHVKAIVKQNQSRLREALKEKGRLQTDAGLIQKKEA